VSASPQQPRLHNGRPVLTTAEASKQSGLNRHYIIQLLRAGRIEGVQLLGHEWMVYEDSLLAYLAQPHSRGKKGERGPRKKRIVRQTEQGKRVLLSTAEAHEQYDYRQDSLLRLRRAGRIEAEKIGGQWYIYEDSLQAYKNRKHPTITTVESTLADSGEPPALPPPEPSGE